MDQESNQVPIAEVDEVSFEAAVLKSEQPVLVAFCASWSQPCHVLEATLAEVAKACAKTVKVVRINADDNPELSLWYEVQSIPTLLYFADASVCARLVGTASAAAILAKMRTAFEKASPDGTRST